MNLRKPNQNTPPAGQLQLLTCPLLSVSLLRVQEGVRPRARLRRLAPHPGSQRADAGVARLGLNTRGQGRLLPPRSPGRLQSELVIYCQ